MGGLIPGFALATVRAAALPAGLDVWKSDYPVEPAPEPAGGPAERGE